MQCLRFLVFLLPCACVVEAANRTVLVTGATGRTGSQAYSQLKSMGLTVRALVRNATKAKAILGCSACDHTEGVFEGDITKPETLTAAMQGVDSLVITVGPSVVGCHLGVFGCHYAPGSSPKEIVWEGLKAQVSAFASSSGPALADRQVVLLSSGLTTEPDNFLDKIGDGKVTFYSLNGEAFLMNSGLQFTIVKACGLGDSAGGKKKLLVAHDDEFPSKLDLMNMIPRADVASVMAAAAAKPEEAKNLRFNLCVGFFGPQQDASQVFQEAMYAWDPRKQSSSKVVV